MLQNLLFKGSGATSSRIKYSLAFLMLKFKIHITLTLINHLMTLKVGALTQTKYDELDVSRLLFAL